MAAMENSASASPVIFTPGGFRRGALLSWPLLIGMAPFALVIGIVIQQKGLSLLDCVLMNAVVYAGASQLVALTSWTHPAPILAATVASFVVNLRMALMGPVLTPWLGPLRPWQRWLSLGLLVDPAWAMAVTDMRGGGRDAAFFLGLCVPLWFGWVACSIIGFFAATSLNLPPGHPLFFAALAVFISLLVPLWRSTADAVPWAVAGLTALVTAHYLPHSSWYIIAGTLSGSLAGAALERRR
jgi:predicted branched-subunit amino acid permease